MNPTEELQNAKDLLKANGFIVLTAKSYYAAQERQRGATSAAHSAMADRDGQQAWLERDIFPRLHHLQDRLTFVYGVARARGASVVELGGSIELPKDALPPRGTDLADAAAPPRLVPVPADA